MKTQQLERFLRRVGRRAMLVDAGAAACDAGVVLLYALLAAVFVTAIGEPTTSGLLLLDAVIIGLLVLTCVHVARRIRAQHYEPRRLARLAEERHGLRDSRLINAVDLASSRGVLGSDALSDAVQSEGDHASSHLTVAKTVDAAPARRSALRLAGPILTFAICAFLLPETFRSSLSRLVSPWGAKSAPSPLTFDVTTTPNPAASGGSATIDVTVNGAALPELADVVFVDQSEERRVPMLGVSAGKFRLPIGRLERPREFYIDTAQGRSDRHTLDVREAPRPLASSAPGTQPAGGDSLRAEAARLRDQARAWGNRPTADEGGELSKSLRKHANAAESRIAKASGDESKDWLATHAEAAETLADATAELAQMPADQDARAEFEAACESFAESVQRRPGTGDGSGQGTGIGHGESAQPAELTGQGDAGTSSAHRPDQGTRPDRVNRAGSERGAVDLDGVPAAYRAAAEAYFKRLADDAK